MRTMHNVAINVLKKWEGLHQSPKKVEQINRDVFQRSLQLAKALKQTHMAHLRDTKKHDLRKTR